MKEERLRDYSKQYIYSYDSAYYKCILYTCIGYDSEPGVHGGQELFVTR